MKLLLVHAKPIATLGGAELSLREHLVAAPDHVDIDVVLPDDPVDLHQYDTVILANLRPAGGLGEDAECFWAEQWTSYLLGYRGYVIKSERDLHPCAHRDARCINVNPLIRTPCDCGPRIREAFENLYNLCDSVQFLSPLHKQVINLLADIRQSRQYVVGSPVDLTKFRSFIPFVSRKKAALITGDKVRVAETAVSRATTNGYEVEFLDYLSAPHDEMPEILNRYQAVVVDPVMIHPYGRLAVEALACGCEVLASRRVGAMSWRDPLLSSRNANAHFWAMVMKRPPAPNPERMKSG